MTVTEFLKQEEIQELLASNDMETVCFNWETKSGQNLRPLVKFFELNGINPLEYMTMIPNGYFYFNPATTVIIPEGVETIHSNAFYRCRDLEEIHIPHSVKDIYKYAINMCIHLNKIVYDGTAKEFNEISDNAFSTEAVSIVCTDQTIEYEYLDN